MAFVLQTFLVTRQREEVPTWKKKRVHMLCRRDATMFFPPRPGPASSKEEVRSFLIFGLFGCCVLVGRRVIKINDLWKVKLSSSNFGQGLARKGSSAPLRSADPDCQAEPVSDMRHTTYLDFLSNRYIF